MAQPAKTKGLVTFFEGKSQIKTAVTEPGKPVVHGSSSSSSGQTTSSKSSKYHGPALGERAHRPPPVPKQTPEQTLQKMLMLSYIPSKSASGSAEADNVQEVARPVHQESMVFAAPPQPSRSPEPNLTEQSNGPTRSTSWTASELHNHIGQTASAVAIQTLFGSGSAPSPTSLSTNTPPSLSTNTSTTVPHAPAASTGKPPKTGSNPSLLAPSAHGSHSANPSPQKDREHRRKNHHRRHSQETTGGSGSVPTITTTASSNNNASDQKVLLHITVPNAKGSSPTSSYISRVYPHADASPPVSPHAITASQQGLRNLGNSSSPALILSALSGAARQQQAKVSGRSTSPHSSASTEPSTPTDLISAAFADKPFVRKKAARLHDGQSISPIDIAVFRAVPVGEMPYSRSQENLRAASANSVSSAVAAAAPVVSASTSGGVADSTKTVPATRTKSRSATGLVLNRKSVGFDAKAPDKIGITASTVSTLSHAQKLGQGMPPPGGDKSLSPRHTRSVLPRSSPRGLVIDRRQSQIAVSSLTNQQLKSLEVESLIPKPGYICEMGALDPINAEPTELPSTYFHDEIMPNKHYVFVGYIPSSSGDQKDPIILSVLHDPISRARDMEHSGVAYHPQRSQRIHLVLERGDKALRKNKITPLHEAMLHALTTRMYPGSDLHLIEDQEIDRAILDYDLHDPIKTVKFPIGIIYSKEGQRSQWDMWNNEKGSADFESFLDLLGDRVDLQGWSQYAGGLDTKTLTKGRESVFTRYKNYQIMFHVSTLLPFHPLDPMKLSRSRVIGNDITTIVFQEGMTPYNPDTIPGDVHHVALVVQPVSSLPPVYRVSCCYKSYMKPFPPEVPVPPLFGPGESLRSFILEKLINGHMAAQRSPGLFRMYTRPRARMLSDLIESYLHPGPENPKKKFESLDPTKILEPLFNNSNTAVTTSAAKVPKEKEGAEYTLKL